MDSTCIVGGESLSRFLDGELSPEDRVLLEAHIRNCARCEHRLSEFRLADGLIHRAESRSRRTKRLATSLSVAAALVASLATNAALTPRKQAAPRPPLNLSEAPSGALSSFYAMVAPPTTGPGGR